MQTRLYIDEDAMDDDLAQALRLRGADVQTAHADEAHPLRTDEEATEVVEYLWQLEREQSTGT